MMVKITKRTGENTHLVMRSVDMPGVSGIILFIYITDIGQKRDCNLKTTNCENKIKKSIKYIFCRQNHGIIVKIPAMSVEKMYNFEKQQKPHYGNNKNNIKQQDFLDIPDRKE